MANNIINTEILQIIQSVATEKNINKNSVIDALGEAIQVAEKRKYGHEHNIEVKIDEKTGEIKLFRALIVVENVDNDLTQISLNDAKLKDEKSVYGSFIYEPLPPVDLGRIAAQSAKRVIIQKIREAERERQYNEFKQKEHEIANIIVKRIEYGNVIADLGNGAEGYMRKDATIPSETFRQNDRIRAYIFEVKRSNKFQQIILSRTANQFLAKLFMQEVPEIYDRIIEIKSVAREPGSRAKIAVYSSDSSIDPVGSCVGVRGSRVQAVINELQGEKIDIIQWSEDPATYVINALSPAEISKVIIDSMKKKIEVVVSTDHLSLAIGRRGQNVRLASQLTGWNIDVLTEDAESKRRIDEFNNISELFVKELNVEEVLAQLLAAEGFTSIEEIAYISIEELASIEGFDDDLAKALQNRSLEYVDFKSKAVTNQIKDLGISAELKQYLKIDDESLVVLGKENIKTIEDFADLSIDEFFEIIPNIEKTREEIGDLIMQART